MKIGVLKKTIKTIYKLIIGISIFVFTVSLVISLFIKISSLKQDNTKAQRSLLIQKRLEKKALENLQTVEQIGGEKSKKILEIIYCLTTTSICNNSNYKDLSLIPKINNAFNYIFNTYFSFSGTQWLVYQMKQIKLLPGYEPVYAQTPIGGIGLYTILPIYNIWKKFRDITYLILSLISLIIGFLILFKVKLNPQTEITIQEALPKIVITLIFITLSFPIAGFMIDLTYLSTGVIVNTLYEPVKINKNNISNQENTQQLKNEIIAELKNQEVKNLLNGRSDSIYIKIMQTILAKAPIIANGLSLASDLEFWFADEIVIFLGTLILGIITSGGMFTIVKSLLDILGFENWKNVFALSILLSLGITFMIILIVLFSGVLLYFKLLGMFLKNLLILIFQIIFSPIIISFSALPNQNTIKQWIKNIIGALIPLPITVLGLYVAYDISQINLDNSITLPYSISIPVGFLDIVIPLLIIFSIPNFVSKIKEFLGVNDDITGGIFSFSGVIAGASVPLGVLMAAPKLLDTATKLPIVGPRIQNIEKVEKIREKLLGPKDPTPDYMKQSAEILAAIAESNPEVKKALERLRSQSR